VLPWTLPHALEESVFAFPIFVCTDGYYDFFHNREVLQVELCGKTIPKHTTVMPQLGAIHFDEQNFPDPERFLPERFLDKHGQYVASKFLIPFGLGKRVGDPFNRICVKYKCNKINDVFLGLFGRRQAFLME